jgi:hypothetical protein
VASVSPAHQLAEEQGFPDPLAEDGRGRLWSRREVKGGAKRLALAVEIPA